MAKQSKKVPDRNTAIAVVIAIVVVSVLFFSNSLNTFSAADVDQIRAAQTRVVNGCKHSEDRSSLREAVGVLLSFQRHNSTQPIALRGNGEIDTMEGIVASAHDALQSRLSDTGMPGSDACKKIDRELLQELRQPSR